jgi:hypothetical protein
MSAKINIGPRISEQTAQFFKETFRSRNAGAEYVMECFRPLYRATLTRLKGRFAGGELKLMLDVMNATALTPGIPGDTLTGNCEDGIALDGLDKKWEIEKAPFMAKLGALSIFETTCLEIWANGFWYGGTDEGHDRELDIEAHVAQLA